MRLVLKDFQAETVDNLVEKLHRAANEVRQSAGEQAVGLSSPTGSGKTAMVTAAIERLFQGDADYEPLPDAVVLWITDQPQLNEQTRRKMFKDSSILNEANLITIGSAFDQEALTPSTVNFLNIQKLGKEKELITKGDERNHTIWETITRTVEIAFDRFFVVIDEAHRGMLESPQARSEANTIIQKFIKGSPGEIPKIPLILGISATLERFNSLVGGTGRTSRPIEVPVDQVRASGLLKEVVTLYHPLKEQPTDITMLRSAARSWRRFREGWKRYCDEQGLPEVKPILVVQVQDASGKQFSRTDLDEVVKAIEDELGGLPASGFAHAFQEGVPISAGAKDIRYLAPADIDADTDVQVVLFKTSLNTGWDCPRAEVMMSFRTAVDVTSIAQLVGRMVRTPLARHVETSDFLNTVTLYLPHYDEPGLKKVVDHLTKPDPETIPPTEFRKGQDQITLVRSQTIPDHFFSAIENLPSYVIPTQRKTSQVKRVMKLARALTNDELEDNAEDTTLSLLLGVLTDEFTRVSKEDQFKKLVVERGKVEIQAINWQVGLDVVNEDSRIILDVSVEDIDDLFEAAGRRIGDEGLDKEWWKLRRREKVDNTTAKLELVALSIDGDLRQRLEQTAQKRVSEWLKEHGNKIRSLSESRREVYEGIRGRAGYPELSPIALPTDIIVSKSEVLWDRHLYVDEEGTYPEKLNTWETAVVRGELDKDKSAVWLRNIPRKRWALTIPYMSGTGKWAPLYPDFIFVRKQGAELAIDLLDPHLLEFADAPARAVGFAQYAERHSDAYNRIELIIVRNDGEKRSIDLMDEAKRNKVLAVKSKEHLAQLFDEA